MVLFSLNLLKNPSEGSSTSPTTPHPPYSHRAPCRWWHRALKSHLRVLLEGVPLQLRLQFPLPKATQIHKLRLNFSCRPRSVGCCITTTRKVSPRAVSIGDGPGGDIETLQDAPGQPSGHRESWGGQGAKPCCPKLSSLCSKKSIAKYPIPGPAPTRHSSILWVDQVTACWLRVHIAQLWLLQWSCRNVTRDAVAPPVCT